MSSPMVKRPLQIETGGRSKLIYVPFLWSVKRKEVINRRFTSSIGLWRVIIIVVSVELISNIFICPFHASRYNFRNIVYLEREFQVPIFDCSFHLLWIFIIEMH